MRGLYVDGQLILSKIEDWIGEMNPHYLWLTELLELIFFCSGPAIAILIARKAWRERQRNRKPKPYGKRCAAFVVATAVLFCLTKWMNADVASPLYFVQLLCALLCFVSLGMATGYFFPVLLDLWNGRKKTGMD